MRRLAPISLLFCLVVAMPAAARGQSAAAPPGSPPEQSPPAAGQTPAKPPAQPAAPAPAPADTEPQKSLFTPTWREVQFGGRASSVDGDEARWQRYQDLRDGVYFSGLRYANEDPQGSWLYQTTADNVGYRDQRYWGLFEKTGKFVVTGLFDQIPQFYSVETKTPYTTAGDGALVLDDATQQRIQNGQATLSAYVPLAPQFDLRERRDIGHVGFLATPTPTLDVKADFTTQRHRGELPWGASFGFGSDVELALPYDSRANDFNLRTEWTNTRNMLRLSYDGSWFDNLDDTLVWDNPIRAVDASGGPSRGRMQLWPSNSAQTISVAGSSKFSRHTKLTGSLSFGFWNNDEPLQPFTINPTVTPQLALPRTSTQADAHVLSTNLNLTSRPYDNFQFNTRLRVYDYSNQTTPTAIPQYVAYDSSVSSTPTGGPKLFAHNRTTFDVDAGYTGLSAFALTAGYTRNNGSYDFRTFDSTSENTLRLIADTVGSSFITYRAKYEYSDRTGSGLDEASLVASGENAGMRHYDIANRTRNSFTGQVDVIPNDMWSFSASAGLGKDDYGDTPLGLQESSFKTFSFGADYQKPNGFGGGANYNYERYKGLQKSRSASAGQENDVTRDWTADTAETVHYFSIFITPPRIGKNTEARLSYDASFAEGEYLYGIVPGGPLAVPNQLPNVFNKLQQFHLDVRHRVSKRLDATFSYLYEPFRVYDFAFDPSVINSIAQPSSLILGYTYQPYTANSFLFGVKYFW